MSPCTVVLVFCLLQSAFSVVTEKHEDPKLSRDHREHISFKNLEVTYHL